MSRFRPTGVVAVALGTVAAVALAAVPADAVPARPGASAPAPIVVSNLADSGAGSLRAAITEVNDAAAGSAQEIEFSVQGVIPLASDLPAIVRPVTINGPSAPTYVPGGAPVVGLNANGHAGLVFGTGSDGSQLLGIAVYGARRHGVTLVGDSITLNNNYIGLDLGGDDAGNDGAGVFVTARSRGNTIGSNPSGASGTVANVISGNAGNGITVKGSDGNTIVANRIGTDPVGAGAVANRGNGISLIKRANGNMIGGTLYVDSATGQANDPTGDKGTVDPTFVVPPLGNLVSGNQDNGVYIGSGSTDNTLSGNFVGTSAGGGSAIPNGADGVAIHRADDNTLSGCKFVNNPFVYYNVVSGNGGNGLRVTDSDNITVQANFFGIGADNTTTVANRRNGIVVDGTSQDTQVGGVIPLGNVVAGNRRNGIVVKDTVSGFITFNTFGGLLAFKGAAPNGRNGFLIRSTGGDNLARTNVFSGNEGNGIEIGGKARGVTVDPNIIGLSTNGQSLLSNGGDGILITDKAHGNVIGGSRRSVIPQNTISGNGGYGVVINGRAHHNTVQRSFIGPEVLGVNALGNSDGGVLLAGRAKRNTIGSHQGAKPVNLVSGNEGPGVTLRSKTSHNKVLRNYIGLDRRGRAMLNDGPAVIDNGKGNVLRGNEQ